MDCPPIERVAAVIFKRLFMIPNNDKNNNDKDDDDDNDSCGFDKPSASDKAQELNIGTVEERDGGRKMMMRC